MTHSAVIVIGPSWKQWAEREACGLTVLGRALLALGDAGARVILVVGGEHDIVSRALRGRTSKAAVCHMGEWANTEDLRETLHQEPDELLLVVEQPFLLDKDTWQSLLQSEQPCTLGDAYGLLVAPLQAFEQKLSIENAAPLVDAPDRIAPLFPLLAKPIETEEDLLRAEKQLLDTTRKPIEVDGLIAFYVMRPISRFLTRTLWSTGVSPNQVTLFAMFLGLCSSPLAASGTYWGHLCAAVLFFFGATIDCVDGEMARLKHMGSRGGEWLDTLADDISTTAYLLGLALGVSWLPFGLNPVLLGVGAAALFVVSSVYIYYVLARYVGVIDTTRFPYFFQEMPGKPRSPKSGFIVKLSSLLTYALKRDFFAALFVMLALCHAPWISLFLLGLGSVVNAAGAFLTAIIAPPHKTASRDRDAANS
jgi:phosphatidylglycerophosphate synthase